MAVRCLLQSANCPLFDWKGVTPSVLSSIRTLINTATKENPDDRFLFFERSEPLTRPPTSAPWRKRDTPACLRKIVSAEDQAPVVPLQISEVISPHIARVSVGDGRFDPDSTSDLSRQPLDDDNKGTIS